MKSREENHFVIGVMSGTSLDGVDLCYVRFSKTNISDFSILHATTIPYSKERKKTLQDAYFENTDTLNALDTSYGKWLGKIIESFVQKITNEYHVFQSQNLILDLSHDKTFATKDLAQFKDLAKDHKKAKKSLILVSDVVDFDRVPNYLNVVPSVLEAHDMIEMDEIERDLGF